MPGDPDITDYGALAAAVARHRHEVAVTSFSGLWHKFREVRTLSDGGARAGLGKVEPESLSALP